MSGIHVMRDGDGTTIYFGRHQGARYVSVNLVGFDVWRSSRRMPGGWWAFESSISTGRLFMDCSRRWSVSLKMPAKLRDFYYWRVRPSGRRYMREHDKAAT